MKKTHNVDISFISSLVYINTLLLIHFDEVGCHYKTYDGDDDDDLIPFFFSVKEKSERETKCRIHKGIIKIWYQIIKKILSSEHYFIKEGN